MQSLVQVGSTTMKQIIDYIIRFLLGDGVSGEVAEAIGYTGDRNAYHRYNLVIVPSGFFDEGRYGTAGSLPSLPLRETEGIPLLFGSPKQEWVGDTWVVHADVIAGTFFLITRYEEMVRRGVRDEHGRFPGKASLPYRAGFLHRPVVDEYRRLLRRWLRQTRLRVPDVVPGIRKIYLTHDVDAPFLYRSWKGLLRSVRDGRGADVFLQRLKGKPVTDPFDTFPWIFRTDGLLQERAGRERVKPVLFLKAGGRTKQDKPRYDVNSTDLQKLVREARTHGFSVGLHASYQAGKQPSLIRQEKKVLETALGRTVRWNRHHFLASREPEDLDRLEAAGFTDDFTMGYADAAGFRLGTAYPVRWINPATRRLSPLRLHPLLMMDCTFDESKYMGSDYEGAAAYGTLLLEQVRRAGGEAVLLWHNTSFRTDRENYHRRLYLHVLNELGKK